MSLEQQARGELEPADAQEAEVIERIALEQIEKVRAGVKNGDLDSMVELADYFRKGRFGIPKNPEVAIQWYQRAAMKGHPGAQYNLGLCYFTGTGVAIDDDKCSLLLHEASKNGHIQAKAHLSQHYFKGTGGVQQNFKKGIELLLECAKAGDRISQLNLGNIYYHGTYEVEQNYKQAARWFHAAAEQKDKLAARMLGYMYEVGLGVPKDVSSSMKWYTSAAKAGDAPSQFTLAAIFEYGTDDIGEDPKASEFWLQEAIKQGYKPAIDFQRAKDL